jgi:hypothetical protein
MPLPSELSHVTPRRAHVGTVRSPGLVEAWGMCAVADIGAQA